MQSLSFAIILLIAWVLAACQSPNSSPLNTSANSASIIGGQASAADDMISKVTVKIFLKGPQGWGACSGTLFASDWVLTAAHCFFEGGLGQAMKVIFNDQRMVDVKRSIVNPSFTMTTIENDIALVQLATEQPGPYAQLADKDFTLTAGAPVMIAGYGWTDLSAHAQPSSTLNQLGVPVADYDATSTFVELAEPIGQSSCYGDSGGPGYIEKEGQVIVWGADSHGNSGACGGNEFYSRVSTLRDWIDSAQIGAPTGATNAQPANK